MKRMLMVSCVCLAAAGCLLPVTKSLVGVVDEQGGFEVTEAVRTYDVADAGDLAAGPSALLIEFGADSCYVADYRRNDERYHVEGITFADEKGALGAYLLGKSEGDKRVDIGYFARLRGPTLQYVKGVHFISVTSLRGGTEDGLLALGRGMAKRIRWALIKPDVYDPLPRASRVDNSELYFRGPLLFSTRFPADLAVVLDIADAREGYAARYTTDKGPVECLKIRYDDRVQTLGVVNAYITSRADRPVIVPGETLAYHTVVETDRSRAFVGEYGEWLYLMLDAPENSDAQSLFEFFLRGGK